MARILLAGINGFVGHHVAVQLHSDGHQVVGVGNQSSVQPGLATFVDEYISCDLTNAEEVKKIDLTSIDAIINLAGFAKVGESRGQGELYNNVNTGVHIILYEECLAQNVAPRIIAVSTGAVYDPDQPLPITEESEIIVDEKTNEYVISKKLMEDAVTSFNDRGLRCIIARPFNHSGPGQLPGFLLPDLGEQIEAAIAENKPLQVGNLDTRRDFTDVRDVARAYVKLATCDGEKLKNTTYNICSGQSVSGKEILQYLSEAYGAPNISTVVDPSKIRENEVMDIFGSSERLLLATNWKPTISVEKMVKDFVVWQKSR